MPWQSTGLATAFGERLVRRGAMRRIGESRDDRQKVWHSRSGVSERFLRVAGEQPLKGVGEPVRVWAGIPEPGGKASA